MRNDEKRVFYFHADASALGGFVEGPFRYVPTQASVALPTAGGHAVADRGAFTFEDVVSCRSTYTHVTGSPRKINGPWIERVTSVVEGLQIADVVTAGRIVARAFVERDEEGRIARASFEGCEFHDVRVQGKQITIALNPILLAPRPQHRPNVHDDFADLGKEIEWSLLSRVAAEQSESIEKLKDVPVWVQQRYGRQSQEAANTAGYTLCSLVDSIDGAPAGITYGHTLVLSDVGRFFLGEVLVHPQSLQLTMVRAELGCNKTGIVTAASVTTNGSGWPPTH